MYAVALGALVVFRVTGFTGTDVGKLRPVQVVRIAGAGDMVILETDTGDRGYGRDPAEALANLKDCAPGVLFLDTADYLVVESGCEAWIPAVSWLLRPSCKICVECGNVDLETAAVYLAIHQPEITLREWLGGERGIPQLQEREGRLELVP